MFGFELFLIVNWAVFYRKAAGSLESILPEPDLIIHPTPPCLGSM